MAQRREPGILVLAQELSSSIEKHVEDREYSPTYLISEIGGKLSRVLIAGVLDQIENRGSEEDPFYTARVIDPNGDYYYLQAGQYNPEGAAALSKLEIGVPVLCVGKVRARTPEDSERTYVSVQPESIRAVTMNEVNHWAIRACDGLMLRIKATKAFDDDNEFEKLKLNDREIDGIKLSKGFYQSVALENYQALLYNCLTRLAGGEVESPESEFTGEFEPAGDNLETTPQTKEPEEDKPEIEVKTEKLPEKEKTNDNESKVMALIRKMDEGDGIYYDDLGIAISMEGIDGPMLDEVLDSLTDQGLIYQPRFNHYKEA
jgi:RPA family protein|tara:strand:+ start:1534 stop:2484 length:951 start_codon:yes stop_codon:yes gene_type:complete